ncbi:MAG: endonuclease/exonuclease/phosphatase [Planctomycetota bacterium]|nr:endonuclease/exonuclease/phosphatase [Planctomycetota bacterium]
MQKVSSWLLVSLIALLGGYLLRDRMGPFEASFKPPPHQTTPRSLAIAGNHPPIQSQKFTPPETLRIASFHITSFNALKSSNPKIIDVLARVIRNFDVVAIQGIQSTDQTFASQFLSLINRNGGEYEYELGPRVGRNANKRQFAFFFNKQTVEIDRQATYTVADPHDRILFEPLVALFRARTFNPDTAFTFKLVNVHLDPLNTVEELDTLQDVYNVVLGDADQEDDVLLLGNFSADTNRLFEWGDAFGIQPAHQYASAGSVATAATDNLCLHKLTTQEFNGKSGVVDIVRFFNLTSGEAAIVSDHFPVWAEFSAREGLRPSRFATRKKESRQSR